MKKRKALPAVAIRILVEERAGWRCEYCHAPAQVAGYRFHVDHIIPKARAGSSAASNRALACAQCNLAKIDRLVGVDPDTSVEAALFNPRKQRWSDHFCWANDNENLLGLTPTGRATILALGMNDELRLRATTLVRG